MFFKKLKVNFLTIILIMQLKWKGSEDRSFRHELVNHEVIKSSNIKKKKFYPPALNKQKAKKKNRKQLFSDIGQKAAQDCYPLQKENK